MQKENKKIQKNFKQELEQEKLESAAISNGNEKFRVSFTKKGKFTSKESQKQKGDITKRVTNSDNGILKNIRGKYLYYNTNVVDIVFKEYFRNINGK